MTDIQRLKIIEETVRAIEQSYYRIYVRACLASGEESDRAKMLRSEWDALLTIRLLFDSEKHLVRMHDICYRKEVKQ